MRLARSMFATAVVIAVQPAAASAQDADQKAAATEARMTDAERFSLLHGLMSVFPEGRPRPNIPADVDQSAGYVPGVPRLDIPSLRETDASLGVINPLGLRTGDVATALPSGLALAATFDPALVHRAGAMIGAEARAKGFNVLLAGGVNLTRDWYGGRNFEYLGEDPLLAGQLGGEMIQGIQSTGVMSTIKHFVLNAQETQRRYVDARIDEAALRESDLLAFQIAIERGQPASVMCSYNLVNGVYTCGSGWLLNTVLKGDWGYKGWVMSDWGTTYDVSWFNAGLDQQSGENLDTQVWFDGPLKNEFAAGRVGRPRLTDAVRRILRSIYAVGADRPFAKAPIDYDAHAQVAQQAAERGIVLLKNDGVLPLAATARTILVVGPYADRGVLSGGGSSNVTAVGGSAAVIPAGGPGFLAAWGRMIIHPSSPLAALRAALPNATIEFDNGYNAETAAARAAKADLVIVFGEQWQSEGLDGSSLTLPQGQDAMIGQVARSNSNTIVVLETGNPTLMPWIGDVKAVVQAWYSGQRGGQAIANVLTGRVNPSGRLPMTFPQSREQTPRPTIPGLGLIDKTQVTAHYVEGADVGYRWYARRGQTPLFPFGFGLSYTSFEHGPVRMQAGAAPTATVTVRNTGSRAGADVPQLYLTARGDGALLRLVAFERVELQPGESRTVTMKIDPRLLASWRDGRWVTEKGVYRFAIGRSATDLEMATSVQLDSASSK